MGYQINWVDGSSGVISSFSGTLTEADIQHSMQECTTNAERFKAYAFVINDFSAVDELQISSKYIIANADQAVELSELNHHLHFVFVVPTDLEMGLARMWAAYAEKTGWQVHFARTREQAEAWLSEQLGEHLQIGFH